LKLNLSSLEKKVAKMRKVERKVGEIEKKLAGTFRKDQTIYIG